MPHLLADLFHESAAEHQRHRAVMNDLWRRVRELQAACPHEHTTHVPDAAGGYDRFDRCDDCGAERTGRQRGQEWQATPSVIGRGWDGR